MREVVASGRTVEEAIAAALERAGLSREEAEIHVLDEGSRGVFGLGAREARVRVVPRSEFQEEPADARTLAAATEIARTLVAKMGFSASVLAHATERGLFVDVRGEELGLLIGRRGQGIEAVETVLAAMVHQATGSRGEVEVDIGGYRARRRQHLGGDGPAGRPQGRGPGEACPPAAHGRPGATGGALGPGGQPARDHPERGYGGQAPRGGGARGRRKTGTARPEAAAAASFPGPCALKRPAPPSGFTWTGGR